MINAKKNKEYFFSLQINTSLIKLNNHYFNGDQHEKASNILGGVLILIALLFTSCENFLKGVETKKQIEESIVYANAPFYTIKVNYQENSGTVRSPAGAEAQKKVTDSFSIAFDPFAAYAFINWKIIDLTTGNELPDGEYLKLEAINKAETKCTFVKKPEEGMQLCLCPVVVERPRVYSWSPTSLDSVRDSTIQVLFDQEMNPNSIYYTKEEFEPIEKSEEVTPLKTTLTDGTEKIYGYEKVKGGEVFFKNISIIDLTTGKSILSKYKAPVLQKGMLTIPAKVNTQAPEAFSQIRVSLHNGFFYTINDPERGITKDIEMAESKIWMYGVNDQKDTVAPSLRGNLVFNGFWKHEFPAEVNSYPYLDWENYKNFWFHNNPNVTSGKLTFTITDGLNGSGLTNSFQIYITKIFSGEKYKNERYGATTPESKPITVHFTTSGFSEASFNGTIDFAERSGILLTEGIYEISFDFTDNAGNHYYYPSKYNEAGDKYYFSIDHTMQGYPFYLNYQMKSIVYAPTNLKLYQIKWGSQSPTSPCDLRSHYIYYGIKGSGNFTKKTIERDKKEVDISLDEDQIYEIKIERIDYAGNQSQFGPIYFNKAVYTKQPVICDDYSGGEPDGVYYKYGAFPQSKLESPEGIIFSDDHLLSGDSGRFYYSGSDGYLYCKVDNDYYKVEPVIWRVLNPEGNDDKILVAENIIYNTDKFGSSNNYDSNSSLASRIFWLQQYMFLFARWNNNEWSISAIDGASEYFSSYLSTADSRKRTATPYAQINGVENNAYWLKNAGAETDKAKFVTSTGQISEADISSSNIGVVPVITVPASWLSGN